MDTPALDIDAAVAALSAASAASAASAPVAADDEAMALSLVLTWAGIVVMVLAQMAAPWVLKRYRRRVEAFMLAPAAQALGLTGAHEQRPPVWTAPALLAGIERRRRQVLWVLVAVVLLYTTMAATAFFYRFENTHEGLLSYAVSFFMFAAFCGPVVLLGVSASRFEQHFWIWFAPATFAAFAMQAVVTTMDGEGGGAGAVGALAGVVVLTMAAVLLRHWLPERWTRRIRALLAIWGWKLKVPVAGLTLAALLALLGWLEHPALHKLVASCAVATVAIALCFLTMVDRIKRTVVPLLGAALLTIFVVALACGAIAVALLQPEGMWARAALGFAAVGMGLLAAYFMLSWIGLAYEQKVFSDAQFQVFSWMLAVSGTAMAVQTMFQQASLIDPSNLQLAAASVAALLAYWLVTRYGLQPLRSNRRLLVLRVFAQDTRGERLMDELEYRWRFIGPIALIGGTDMAAHTIDPAKAANFLRGRMKDGFVPNAEVLNRRVNNFDDEPDPDGRYRINEFFCFCDIWQLAVQRLLQDCDAVVVDLRGFTAARRGTAWELAQLRDTGALTRTVFLIDRETDQAAVHQALGSSPALPLPAARVMAMDRWMDGEAIVEALVHCLDAPRPALPEAQIGPALRSAA